MQLMPYKDSFCIEKYHNTRSAHQRQGNSKEQKMFSLSTGHTSPHISHRCYKNNLLCQHRPASTSATWWNEADIIWVSLKSGLIFQATYLTDKNSLTTQFHKCQASEDGVWGPKGDIVLADLCPSTRHRFWHQVQNLHIKQNLKCGKNNCTYRCWVLWNKVLWV